MNKNIKPQCSATGQWAAQDSDHYEKGNKQGNPTSA